MINKKIYVLLLLVALTGGLAKGQLKLIPTPQIVELTKGQFVFNSNVTIAVANKDYEFSVNELAKVIKKQYSSKVSIGKSRNSNIVISTDETIKPQGYNLIVSDELIFIKASDSAGVFYAVGTLIQIIEANSIKNKIPNCEIDDWPDLQRRGWQDDISRGPIATMDYLKREIRTMASFKYNFMTLYIEHVFKLKKHPTIAPVDGVTAEEIQELVEYAKPYHVEIMASSQSFGHVKTITDVDGYHDLGENTWKWPWHFNVTNPKVYDFLEDMYEETLPAYQSKMVNIGADEVDALGTDPAVKKLIDQSSWEDVYVNHITKVFEILKPYNKEVWMWGDVALLRKNIIPKLPENINILMWDYNAKDD